jgi:hypothetical protein
MKAFAALSDLILKPSEYRIVSETTLCQVGWSVSYKRQTGRQTGRQAGRQAGGTYSGFRDGPIANCAWVAA